MREMQQTLANHPDETEPARIVLSSAKSALRQIGAGHVLAFGFRTDAGRLYHHLVFATKNLDAAQKIMKAIMSGASSVIDDDGVGSFEFDPRISAGQSALIEELRALDALKRSLLSMFRGQTLRVIQAYRAHEEAAETPFTFKNYQDALRKLAYDDHMVTVSKGGFAVAESHIRRRHMDEEYDVTLPA